MLFRESKILVCGKELRMIISLGFLFGPFLFVWWGLTVNLHIILYILAYLLS